MKFAVIGDSCLDIFDYCTADRLAPDVPIPVLTKKFATKNPGMAANVARNLEQFGHQVDLITNANWREVRKTRIVDITSNHTFLRIDSDVTPKKISRLPRLEEYDAVLVSDYAKGFLDEEIIEKFIKSHGFVLMDTKRPIGTWAENVTMLKLNLPEWHASCENISSELLTRTVITLGSKGARWRNQEFPAETVSVADTSGAGDTFFAAFASSLAGGADFPTSIRFAISVASTVVSERGVSIART